MSKGEFEKAILDFDTCIKLDPKLAVAFLNRGIANYRLSKSELALADYYKSLELFGEAGEGANQFTAFLKENIKLLIEKGIPKPGEVLNSQQIKKRAIEKVIDDAIEKIRQTAQSDNKAVVHYTKLFVADIYVKTTEVKMHYSNAIYMNDPDEGRVLFKCFNDKEIESAYYSGERHSESGIYLGSFLPSNNVESKPQHEDELVMWRTYGKDENGNEATGCSIVIDSSFFKPLPGSAMALDPSNELLNVIYIKNLTGTNELLGDSGPTIQIKLNEIKENIVRLIELKKEKDSDDLLCIEIDKSVYIRLSEITYLFKSADYQYENEVRVVKRVSHNGNLIRAMSQTQPGKPAKRFYIESINNVLPFIRKIYLGPKVENLQEWRLFFDLELKKCSKELAKNPHFVKGFDLSTIEILKSKVVFR